jgi:phosphoglycolate phosphatase
VSSKPQRIALLWDIDGTLLDAKGISAKQLVESFNGVTGRQCSIYPGQYSGFTDFEIVLDLLQTAGLHPDIARAEKIFTHYGTRLKDRLLENPPQLLADVQTVFQKIEQFPYIQHFIGTGNSKLGAEAKITASGLKEYFTGNAYFISTQARVSRDLVIQAAAEEINLPILLIGDSDRDVFSAKKNNLKVLATATGRHKVDDLKNLNPDFLLGENWNAKDFLDVISSFSLDVRYQSPIRFACLSKLETLDLTSSKDPTASIHPLFK